MMKAAWMFLALVAGASSALAQPARSPARKADVAPTGSITVSLEYDGILSRGMDETRLKGTLASSAETVDVDLSSNFIYARGAFSVFALPQSPFAVEVYGLVGGADLSLDGDVEKPGQPTEAFDVQGDFGFAIGGGARARLYSVEGLVILADLSFRYSSHDTTIKEVSNLALDVAPGDSTEQFFTTAFFEARQAVYASYRFPAGEVGLAPYGGIQFSEASLSLDGHENDLKPDGSLRNKRDLTYESSQDMIFGLFAGLEATFTPNAGGFLEIHIIDQFEISLGGRWTF